MTAKYIFYSVVFLVLLGLLFASYYFYSKSNVAKVESNSYTYSTTTPVVTKIIREYIKADIDTVWINNQSHEVAYYSATIDTNKVSVDLNIKYDELLNVFSLKANVISMVDSVFVEKETVKTVIKKPKFIGLTSGISIGVKSMDEKIELSNAGLDVGLKFAGKYSVSGYANTDKQYGLRLGLDF